MKSGLKIGIVGCGAIGISLAKIINCDLAGQARLSALYDLDYAKAEELAKKVSYPKSLAVKSLKELILRSELVIEAASAHASWEIARKTLACGRDMMIMSVGGIVSHFKELSCLAASNGARVYIPSGAICGIDALKGAGLSRIKKVTLTTRKHPRSFKGVKYIQERGIDLDKIKKDRVLFSGKAESAMRYFPQNINVAGILSIAGLGADKTHVTIVASPQAKKNIHEVLIESVAARVFTRTENVLHPDNPKTSYLAVLSAAATLKQLLQPVRVGT